jgi:hypothetical protein
MPVLYRGERIVPAPLVAISKNNIRTGNDEKVGTGFILTLTGTLLPHKGTPYTDGSSFTDPTADPSDQTVTRRPSGLMSKMAALRDLFAEDGKLFHIYPCDLSDEEIACYPIVQSVDFNDGTWTSDIDYQIVLTCPIVSGTLNGTTFSVFPSGEDASLYPYIKDSSESWSIETAEPESDVKIRQHTFRVTHNLSAVGQRVFFASGSNHLHGVINREPWEWAKSWCESKLITNPVYPVMTSGASSGILNYPSGYLNAYNHLRTYTIDKGAGAYAVNDTWILSSGNAFEDFSITVQQSADDGLTAVSVEGNIQGLESINYLANNNNVVVSKWEAASGLFNTVSGNIYNRANVYNGSLHTTPLNSTIGRNPVAGTINYNFTFNDRPSNCIASNVIISELIEIEVTNPTDIFSNIAIVGRSAGALLQDMNTSTAAGRLLNIEVVYKPSGCLYGPPVNIIEGINSYIAAYSGSIGTSQIFRYTDTENSSIKTGRYRRTIGWTLGNCS